MDTIAAGRIMARAEHVVCVWSPWWSAYLAHVDYAFSVGQVPSITGLSSLVFRVDTDFLGRSSIMQVAVALEFALQQAFRHMDDRVAQMMLDHPEADETLVGLAATLEITSDLDNTFSGLTEAAWASLVNRSVDPRFVSHYDVSTPPDTSGLPTPDDYGYEAGLRAEKYLRLLLEAEEAREQEWLEDGAAAAERELARSSADQGSAGESGDQTRGGDRSTSPDGQGDRGEDRGEDQGASNTSSSDDEGPSGRAGDTETTGRSDTPGGIGKDDPGEDPSGEDLSNTSSTPSAEDDEADPTDTHGGTRPDGPGENTPTDQDPNTSSTDTTTDRSDPTSPGDSTPEDPSNTSSTTHPTGETTPPDIPEDPSDIPDDHPAGHQPPPPHPTSASPTPTDGGDPAPPGAGEDESLDWVSPQDTGPRYVSLAEHIRRTTDPWLTTPPSRGPETLVGKSVEEMEEITAELAESILNPPSIPHLPSASDDFTEWARTRLAPSTVSWKRILPGMLNVVMSRATMSGMTDLSYSKPNPNQPDDAPIMMGFITYPPEVTILVDVSPSMQQHVGTVMSEFIAAMKRFFLIYAQPVTVATADGKVRWAQQSVTPYDAFSKQVTRTYQGTSHDFGQTIKQIMKKGVKTSRQTFPKPDILVVFTDCEFEFPWPDQGSTPKSLGDLIIVSVSPHDRVAPILPKWIKPRRNFVSTS